MAFGIDFGTTNSATVELVENWPKTHGGRAGRPYPSLLAIDKLTGEVVARGEAVQKLREEDPVTLGQCEIIINPKLLLGSDYAKRIGGILWCPKDFVREIFIGLSEVVKNNQGDFQEAVVAVPVNFAARKRSEIREGANGAGVKISGFISEPTAAVYKYRDKLDNLRKLAVFDWGGGTLDIALLDIDPDQKVTELDAVGLELGGSHLDKKIASYLYGPIQKETGIAWNELSSSQQYAFLANCETAKIRLSREKNSAFTIPNFSPGYHAQGKLERAELDALLQTEKEKAAGALQALLKKNGLLWNDIGSIIMVGGSSQLYGMREYLEEISEGCTVLAPGEDSDWAVAHGAALLSENPGSYIISGNIGLRLADGNLFPLYQDGDVIQPGENSDERKLNFGIVEDTQTAVFKFARWHDAANVEDIGFALAKCNGFVDEAMTLSWGISSELEFQATIESSFAGEPQEKTFHYDNVLFRYAF